MTTMYDSTTAGDIPIDAAAVAGYVNGAEAWDAQDWSRFIAASRLGIDVTNAGAGGALDIEKGDATPEEAAGWVRGRHAAGISKPWLYIDESNWAGLHEIMLDADLPAGSWAYWVASWRSSAETPAPGVPLELPDGTKAAAVQYANPATSGGHFDLSELYAALPAVDGGPDTNPPAPAPAPPAPAPPPAPPAPSQPTQEDDDVQVTTQQQGSTGAEVKAIQSILNGKAGAHLAVDGDFGGVTEAAVKAWQTFYRLEVDGIVGPATWATLIGG